MSPRNGPRRPQVAIRLSESGIQHLDSLATEAGLVKGDGSPNRSEVIRRILALAMVDPAIRRKVIKP